VRVIKKEQDVCVCVCVCVTEIGRVAPVIKSGAGGVTDIGRMSGEESF
jgi:hypothetical protein